MVLPASCPTRAHIYHVLTYMQHLAPQAGHKLQFYADRAALIGRWTLGLLRCGDDHALALQLIEFDEHLHWGPPQVGAIGKRSGSKQRCSGLSARSCAGTSRLAPPTSLRMAMMAMR